jgi:hypothetical protein
MKYEFQYPEWQTPLQDFIVEVDSSKRLRSFEKAQSAITERLSALRREPGHEEELQALSDGQYLLDLLRRNREARAQSAG